MVDRDTQFLYQHRLLAPPPAQQIEERSMDPWVRLVPHGGQLSLGTFRRRLCPTTVLWPVLPLAVSGG